jgi:hypothetical protein
MTMTMTMTTIEEAARTLGGNAADAYSEEFGESPDRETIGDWDSAAWESARKELRDLGMTDDDYDACLAEWWAGFFGA